MNDMDDDDDVVVVDGVAVAVDTLSALLWGEYERQMLRPVWGQVQVELALAQAVGVKISTERAAGRMARLVAQRVGAQ